jgi:beta-mannosidase
MHDEWWAHLWHLYPRLFGSKLFDQLFPVLVRQLDPMRFYWNGSPFSDRVDVKSNDPLHGDTHYWTLHTSCGDPSEYSNHPGGFVSETGIQALPDLRTALEIGREGEKHIQSFLFESRNHFESMAKNDRLIKFISAFFRYSDQFEQGVHLSNLAQGEYLKQAVEHWRSLAPDCSGVLIWQLNDCWPCISWSAVDYNLLPKASYYYLQRAFAEDIVIFKQKGSIVLDPERMSEGEVFVCINSQGKREGTLRMQIVRLDGEIMDTSESVLEVTGPGATCIQKVRLNDFSLRRFDSVLHLSIDWNDDTQIENVYTLSRPKYMHLRKPEIELVKIDDRTFSVRTDTFAKGIYLFHPEKSVVLDDNYFDLMPGKEKLVRSASPFEVSEIECFSYYHF